MSLSGPAREILHDAILGAFSHEALRKLTDFKLNLNLDHVALADSLSGVVRRLIDHCENHGLTAKLIEAVKAARPNNEAVKNLDERSQSAPAGPPNAPSLPGDRTKVPVGRGLFQLPPRLKDFTGRAGELKQIADRLRAGPSVALRGMGGVGKTKTAVEACWEVKDAFPDAQLVVELRGMSEQPPTAVQAMSQVIRDFHPETDKLPDDENELLQRYRNVLRGKKALVLLDDAKDEAQLGKLLEVEPPVAFVVTSRNALALDGVESIRLGVLPPGAAFTLLRGIVGPKGTDDELRTVAELCGRLPLALRVAGDFIRLRENWSLSKYIDALRDEAKRLERLKGKTPDRDVEAVLGLSARELIRENPDRAERWQMLSVFPADFDAQAAAAVWDLKAGEELDEPTATDELTALLDRGLVQYDADTDRYSLHDLMRPIAREAFEFVEGHALQAGAADRIAAAERRFAVHYCDVLRDAHVRYLKGNEQILHGLDLFDREQANIRHGQTWATRHRNSDRSATEECRNYAMVGGPILDLRLRPRERITWFENALAVCREMGDREDEGTFLGSLGNAWADLGDARKAIDLYEQHLAIAREVGNREHECVALENLGVAWNDLGDAHKAVSFHDQALVIAREIGDRRREGLVLQNLGSAWNDLGDARKALSFFEQSLVFAREFGDRLGEGHTLTNLGVVWRILGDARKAASFYEQALVIAREIGDRRGEGLVLRNLGIAWKILGDARKAASFYEQALMIARDIGDRHAEGTD